MHTNLEQCVSPAANQSGDILSSRRRFDRLELKDGVALCLSGGGYAGMLFSVGSLWRLNEVGWLRRIDEISSVSAATITAGTLAAVWDRLDFDAGGVAARFAQEVVAPLRRLAHETLDMWSIIGGEFSGQSVGDIVANAYDECLFGGITLQQLADHACERPRFVFTALDVFSGGLIAFSPAGLSSCSAGRTSDLRLALAVSAATAFPPMMPPVNTRSRGLDDDVTEHGLALIDAGVCNGLALEGSSAAYRTLLVSDGNVTPPHHAPLESSWFAVASRVLDVVRRRDQNRRRQWLRRSFGLPRDASGEWRNGKHWDCHCELPPDPGWTMPYSNDASEPQPGENSRLEEMADSRQQYWINRGYAACAAAMSATDWPVGRPLVLGHRAS